MDKINLIKALNLIVETQEQTCPVVLKIGAIGETNFIHHNELIIMDCAGAILTKLKVAGFSLSMSQTFGGLVIEKY